jgi:hypothetical protein
LDFETPSRQLDAFAHESQPKVAVAKKVWFGQRPEALAIVAHHQDSAVVR